MHNEIEKFTFKITATSPGDKELITCFLIFDVACSKA